MHFRKTCLIGIHDVPSKEKKKKKKGIHDVLHTHKRRTLIEIKD